MVPKTHGFSVDDQVILYLLRLGAQPVILRNAGIEGIAGARIAHAVWLLLRHGGFDGVPEPRHSTQ
jgi:hypothetical protein